MFSTIFIGSAKKVCDFIYVCPDPLCDLQLKSKIKTRWHNIYSLPFLNIYISNFNVMFASPYMHTYKLLPLSKLFNNKNEKNTLSFNKASRKREL
jgi:hypothetical protein